MARAIFLKQSEQERKIERQETTMNKIDKEELWEEFQYLEDIPEVYADNSLLAWCRQNPMKGEQIMKEWDKEKNVDLLGNPIEPKDICRGSDKLVWWKCTKCGRSYKLSVRFRLSYQTGCSSCRRVGTSYSEQFLYVGIKQCFPDAESRAKVGSEKLEFDITIPSINTYIEYSGEFWHKTYRNRDNEKKEYCRNHNIRFIEILEMKKNTEMSTDGNVIKYKFNETNQDETLYKILLELYKMIGFTTFKPDYNRIVRDVNERLLRPVENNLLIKFPKLKEEWDETLNNGAKIECFTCSSSKRIIWKCIRCGGTWNTTIANRTEFLTGCPKCGYRIFDGAQKVGRKYIRFEDISLLY